MATTGHPHVGDVHVIRLTVTTDGTVIVELVGPVTLRFQKPDGVTFDVTASLVTDGTDGQAEYETSITDLDQSGTWQVQLKDGDGPWHADVKSFEVFGNLPEPA